MQRKEVSEKSGKGMHTKADVICWDQNMLLTGRAPCTQGLCAGFPTTDCG